MTEMASKSGIGRLIAGITGSAESFIAVALLAVCAVVGGALWWFSAQEVEAEPAAKTSTASAAPALDESAVVDDYKRRLGEQFDEINQQRRRAEDEDARRARIKAEEAAAAEARRKAEQARLEAEARAREAKAAAPPPVKVAAAPLPRREPVIVPAAIDWSSCRRPSYPDTSVSRGEEGVVVAEIKLDASARIVGSRVAQSSGFDRLDRAAMNAILKCSFQSETADGVAKASTASVRFAWKLEN